MGEVRSIANVVLANPATELLPRHHAILFGIITNNAVELAGEEGKQVVIAAVQEYGLQRGRRMRKRALQNGDDTSMTAYRAYCEWKAPQGCIRSVLVQRSPVLITRTVSCPWYDAWHQNNLTEESHCYCDTIDKYLAMGFDKNLKLDVKQAFSDGALDYCEFTWHGVDYTEANERLAVEMRNRLEESCVLDWLYHIRHLLYVMSHTLSERLENADWILQKSERDFLTLFGEQFSFIFEKSDDTDYEKI